MLLSLSLHIKIRGTHTNNVFPFLTVIFIALLFTKLHASIVYVFSVKLGTPYSRHLEKGGRSDPDTQTRDLSPKPKGREGESDRLRRDRRGTNQGVGCLVIHAGDLVLLLLLLVLLFPVVMHRDTRGGEGGRGTVWKIQDAHVVG